LIPLAEIEDARERIAGAAIRTPLVRLPDTDIWLKLENLQPIGSFKIRGGVNAIRQAPPDAIAGGVVAASAGNFAQGVAWAAREAGVPVTVVVPDAAPQTKLAAIERLGGRVVKVPYDEWFEAIRTSRFDRVEGLFVAEDEPVMAGNGTIGLELVEELPDLDAVVVPMGGGALVVGIASAVKALRPEARVYTAEPVTAAPLAASLPAGMPREVEYKPSFVDGAGAPFLLAEMWPLLSELVDDALVASLDETAAAVRLLAERVRVIAEGAGALALAVALSGRAGGGTIACIISGGNIDLSTLSTILDGRTPGTSQ
jgi:threonine dehydratase